MNSKSLGTTELPLDSRFSAIRLGQDGYIFASLAFNLFLLILALEESIKTRHWKGLPLLDYLSLTSMVVASSAGGTGIAEACAQKHKQGKNWKGESGSEEAGEVRVRLVQSKEDEIPRIQLAEAQNAFEVGKGGIMTETSSLVKADTT